MVMNTLIHFDFSEKMQRFQDYIQAIEEERDKIRVFQRELPLCFELVTQAIETCKRQLHGTTTECNLGGKSECSEQTSPPVFAEFIPLKRASSHSDGKEQESQKQNKDLGHISNTDGKNGNEKNSMKSDWLRSVQLWNQATYPSSKEDSPRKVVVADVKRNDGGRCGGAFQPFRKEKSLGTSGTSTAPMQVSKNKSLTPGSTSSTTDTGGGSGGGNKKDEKEGESLRKSRRCWSQELHGRFVQALHQLGGSHVATPKQIRELMKVDGLTNDEVKSHLQVCELKIFSMKVENLSIGYTIEDRVIPSKTTVTHKKHLNLWYWEEYGCHQNMLPPWLQVPQPGMSPVLSLHLQEYMPQLLRCHNPSEKHQHQHQHPPRQRQLHSDDRGSHSGEAGAQGSHSPATSSSTHTNTTSLSY